MTSTVRVIAAICISTVFTLSGCTKRQPTEEEAVTSRTQGSPDRWSRVEVFYSHTKEGDINWLAARSGLSEPKDLNCHFVVCNGLGGNDGDILSTEKWQNQESVVPPQNWYNARQTIRICVVADGEKSFPTDCQIKRVDALVRSLMRKFAITPENVLYPGDISDYAANPQ